METKRISIDKIVPNQNNPRSEIGDTADLEASIKAHGLIQPIVVTYDVDNNRYEVVAGSRRLQALKNIGSTEVDCIVNYSEDSAELYKIATAENIARKNMSPADECRAIKNMVENGTDIRSIAAEFGHSVRWAMGRHKMADLGEEVLKMVEEGTITLAHAEVLTMCNNDEDVKKFSKLCTYRDPDGLKNVILAEMSNLSKACFDTKKICKNCPKQTICQQDIFGDITDSYCRDGECFQKHVDEFVDKKRKQLLANGYNEYTDSYEWGFKSGYDYINPDNANESSLETIEKIKANGGKMWFLIDEDNGEVIFRWKRSDAVTEGEKEETEDENSGNDYERKKKIQQLANDKEREAVEKVIDRELDHCTDDLIAIIFDYINQNDYDGEKFAESTVDADGDEYDEGAVANVSPIAKTLSGKTQREYILEKMLENFVGYSGCCYKSESEREFFKLKPRDEYLKEAEEEVDNEDEE